jgi:hypothetical protein
LETERLCLPLKGISFEKTYIGKLPYIISITFTTKIWGLTKIGDFIVDFLRKFAAIFKKGPWGLLDEKKREVKNLVPGPL